MKYRKGYKYQLAEAEKFVTTIRPGYVINTEFIHLAAKGRLMVRRGYAWDGPSGPTWDTKNSMRGSLYHDAIYQLIRQGRLNPKWRAMADKEFGGYLQDDGMSRLRSYFWVRELKNFGGPSADPRNRKKIFTAP